VTRRVAPLAIACALAAVPSSASASFALGVSAGELTPRSARLWTHSTESGRATVVVVTDRRFRHVVRRKRANAKTSDDNTVQATVRGLRPGKHYFYRWRMGGSTSRVGEFETALSPRSSRRVTFAFSGDADAARAPGGSAPFYNHFEIYRQMAAEQNDFNVNLGDTIYSDSEIPGLPTALTKEQKWAKYQQNLALRNLQSLRARGGLYSHWDDHEFIDDFSVAENGGAVYQAGLAAFRDYAPVNYSSRLGIYRTFRWGKNLQLFFLDERSFRDAKASSGGTCNNPQTGKPDLAPTVPQSIRDRFAPAIPSLGSPVSQQCRDRINDPAREFLGSAQLSRFLADVKRSTARFKVILNEVPIQQIYTLPYDRWEGYEAERQKVLTYLRDNVKGAIFLSTDVHASFAGDARLKTLEQGGPVNSGILDVTTGPVATRTYEKEIDVFSGRPGAGRLADDGFFEPAPPNGVGLRCSVVNSYGYGQVIVTSKKLTVQLNGLDGDDLDDEGGDPCPDFTVNG
jgi:alkaline phosphatase D